MSSQKRGVVRTAGSILSGTASLASSAVRLGLWGIGAGAAVVKIGFDEAKRGYKAGQVLSSAKQDQTPEQQELDLEQASRS